jgi:hypothetical protein
MLGRSTTTALVAVAMFAALAPPTSAPVEAGHRGGNFAAGIILGAAALAILSSSARAHPNSFAAKCYRWYHQCRDGNDWACEKFETRGCSE